MSEVKTKKKPQDHEPKKLTAGDDGLFWVKLRGRKWSIDPARMDDFELLADLHTVDSGGMMAALAMTSVLKGFLGPDQYREAMELLRNAEGTVTVEAGAEFVAELLGALNPNS